MIFWTLNQLSKEMFSLILLLRLLKFSFHVLNNRVINRAMFSKISTFNYYYFVNTDIGIVLCSTNCEQVSRCHKAIHVLL